MRTSTFFLGKTMATDETPTKLSDPFLRTEELARLLNVNRATLNNWVREHLIPSVQLGKRSRRFIRTEIEAWLETAKKQRKTEL